MVDERERVAVGWVQEDRAEVRCTEPGLTRAVWIAVVGISTKDEVASHELR